ncbi:MAG: DUF1599 domain-containing protein [Bacteroidetes bacterium]|nr:DUF1599 domain-containing protein [Bacteroidota bacterium]
MPLNKEDLNGLFRAWHDEVRNIYTLFSVKHKSYGPDNISGTGIQGVVIRSWDKINRLRRLVVTGIDDPLVDESVEDTLMDLANYAIIGLLLLHNIWPEFEE